MAQRFIKGSFSTIPNKNVLRGLPGNVQAVYFWVCDYANENGQCYPSRKRLASDAGVSIKSVDRALAKLTEISVLHKQKRFSEGEPDTNLYTLMITDVGSVTQTPPSVTVTPQVASHSPYRSVTVTHRTKTNRTKTNKNNTTNVVLGADAPSQYGKPEINDLFSYWEQTVGYKLESRAKQNRMACSNLLKKHGTAKLQQVIRGVALTRDDEYAPRIADFIDLQAKYNQLLAWGRTKQKAHEQRVVRIKAL